MVIIKKTGLIISEDTKRTKSEDGAAKLFANHSMIGLPSSWDWRNVDKINYMTPIQNQGDCGSCVAFGTNAAIEVSKRVANHSPKEDVKLSEWDIFSHGGSCYNGWTLEGANVAAKNYGMCPDKCWPYNGEKQSCASDRTLKTRITGSVRISSDAEAKAWIATKGPIQAAMNVYEDFYEVNSSKIYKHEYGNLAGGHCICICGYDNTNNCWIGKNSWSTEWGDNGYFRIAYGDCGILRDYIAYGEQVASSKVQLTINTKNVDSATIYNDNTIIGKTNINIFLDPGNYNLT